MLTRVTGLVHPHYAGRSNCLRRRSDYNRNCLEMRLNLYERNAIAQTARAVFAPGTTVLLFGAKVL